MLVENIDLASLYDQGTLNLCRTGRTSASLRILIQGQRQQFLLKVETLIVHADSNP